MCVCVSACDNEYLLSYDASHHTPQHPLTHTHIFGYIHTPTTTHASHTLRMKQTHTNVAHTQLLPMSTDWAFVYPWWNENCDGSCSSCYISPCEQLANCTGGGGKTYTVPHDTVCLCVWFLESASVCISVGVCILPSFFKWNYLWPICPFRQT